jgi:hypothetical protein
VNDGFLREVGDRENCVINWWRRYNSLTKDLDNVLCTKTLCYHSYVVSERNCIAQSLWWLKKKVDYRGTGVRCVAGADTTAATMFLILCGAHPTSVLLCTRDPFCGTHPAWDSVCTWNFMWGTPSVKCVMYWKLFMWALPASLRYVPGTLSMEYTQRHVLHATVNLSESKAVAPRR